MSPNKLVGGVSVPSPVSLRPERRLRPLMSSPDSRRIINLSPVMVVPEEQPAQPALPIQPEGMRVVCGHCGNTFLVGPAHRPHRRPLTLISMLRGGLNFQLWRLILCCVARLANGRACGTSVVCLLANVCTLWLACASVGQRGRRVIPAALEPPRRRLPASAAAGGSSRR